MRFWCVVKTSRTKKVRAGLDDYCGDTVLLSASTTASVAATIREGACVTRVRAILVELATATAHPHNRAV